MRAFDKYMLLHPEEFKKNGGPRMQFHETKYGRRFFDVQLPRLADSIERVGKIFGEGKADKEGFGSFESFAEAMETLVKTNQQLLEETRLLRDEVVAMRKEISESGSPKIIELP